MIDKSHFKKNMPVNAKLLMHKALAAADKRLRESNAETETEKEGVAAKIQAGVREGTGRKTYLPPESEAGLVPKGFEPDPSQKEAIQLLAEETHGCLTGAAGTGKTSVMRLLVNELIYRKQLIHSVDDVAFVAFTGTATQVMKNNLPDWLRPKVMTIHEALEYAPEGFINDSGNDSVKFVPRRTAQNPMKEKVIFIDEASMVSEELYGNLVDATPGWKDEQGKRHPVRFYAIGDLNQMTPVAGISAFREQLATWPAAELTVLHRQADPKAQGIIDAAHRVLRGETPLMTTDSFEEFLKDEWSVWGFELNNDAQKAANQILGLLAKLTTLETPDGNKFYDPHRDRVLTPGNGFDDSVMSSMLQQYPLNIAAAPYFDPPSEENPVTVISYGLDVKKFACGFRVMATKNEPPNTKGRVTNGTLGRIIKIERNLAWSGDWGTVGPEERVKAEKAKRFEREFSGLKESKSDGPSLVDEASKEFSALLDTKKESVVINNLTKQMAEKKTNKRLSGPASHEVTVRYNNGSVRTHTTQAAIEALQLAYVTTVAKSQGSQHETVIMIVHHAVKFQLCRELIYTAITRATRRVLILYTPYGLSYGLSKQRIRGNTLQEKIDRWIEWSKKGNSGG